MYNIRHMSIKSRSPRVALTEPMPRAIPPGLETPKPPDRRVARTRAALRDAVFALIREKGFDALTVQDITDRANLSRATFYLHFKDKEELLTVSLQEIYEALRAPGPEITLAALCSSPEAEQAFFAGDLQHVADYAELYRTMLSEQGVWPFWTRILDYLREEARGDFERLVAENRRPVVVPIELVASFCAGASLGVLRWWLLEAPTTPIPRLAQMIQQIESYGLWWALGIETARPTPTRPGKPRRREGRKA